MFPRIAKILYGRGPNLKGIEEEFRPLAEGNEELSLKHIEIIKDANKKYWQFFD